MNATQKEERFLFEFIDRLVQNAFLEICIFVIAKYVFVF